MTRTLDTSVIETTLNQIFIATFETYWKTHVAHWNITGVDFAGMHKLLAEQYEALHDSVDDIAERLRVFGLAAPSELPALHGLPLGTNRNAYLQDIIAAHTKAIDSLAQAIDTLESAGDTAGADFLTQRLAEHEKMNWMLQSAL